MAHDALLLENGDFFLLENGDHFLLESQMEHIGPQLIGPTQRADPKLGETIFIPVEFTFQLISNLLTRGIIKLTAFTETLPKIKIEKSIVISMRGLKDKLKPLADKALKKANDDYKASTLLHIIETDPLSTLKIIKALLKRKK